jgi:serine phosphatase RsbU (regulator of sigma subunit)
MFSDGVLEGLTAPEEGLRAAEQLAAASRSADEMADRILAAVTHAPLADDLTAVVVRRESS